MIKKYICKIHNLVTTRKGIRNHLGKEHTRNKYKNSELINGQGVWSREEFK
jgi:hypothetical protein